MFSFVSKMLSWSISFTSNPCPEYITSGCKESLCVIGISANKPTLKLVLDFTSFISSPVILVEFTPPLTPNWIALESAWAYNNVVLKINNPVIKINFFMVLYFYCLSSLQKCPNFRGLFNLFKKNNNAKNVVKKKNRSKIASVFLRSEERR